MESKAKALGHPIHPMLIVFPLGLLATAVIFDLIGLATEESDWHRVAYYLIGAGIVGGLLAAIFGLVDWLAIPTRTRAKGIGILHALSNTAALIAFAVSWYIRYRGEINDPSSIAIILAIIGALIATVGGWLGGELVYRLRVGVDENSHLNAPNSLTESSVPRTTVDYPS